MSYPLAKNDAVALYDVTDSSGCVFCDLEVWPDTTTDDGRPAHKLPRCGPDGLMIAPCNRHSRPQ